MANFSMFLRSTKIPNYIKEKIEQLINLPNAFCKCVLIEPFQKLSICIHKVSQKRMYRLNDYNSSPFLHIILYI